MYYSIINVEDCKLLQYDKDAVRNLCLVNSMKLCVGKTAVVSYACKTNSVNLSYNYVTN
jgi:hypothetical protein